MRGRLRLRQLSRLLSPQMWGEGFRQRIVATLGRILNNTVTILSNQVKIMTALSDLQDAVNAEETVEAAILTYLQGVPGLITAAVNDGASSSDLIALSNKIGADTAALSTALQTAPPETVTPPAVSSGVSTPSPDGPVVGADAGATGP